MTNDMLTYYAQPGPTTDPGPYVHLFDGLPTDIPALVKTLQGVMVHIFWAGSYGLELTDERKAEVNLRTVEKQLARILELDDRPLTEARPHERKLVG
ncbi:MAG TPA: transglutaminase domain-containing protein, partial [Anaerolineae bacterium]|nr:transglutaminase domain-containing protein [Anaerolineae bacterium]HQK13596.1 transglutaminase domain-containing protein [Anaerolineae bacterium]